MFSAAVAFTLFLPFAQADKKPDDAKDEPQVVARGKDYIIHALRDQRDNIQRGDFILRPAYGDGYMLLHTTLSSGKMTVLAKGAFSEFKGPPMGLDRHWIYQRQIVDFRADKDRLYFLQSVYESGVGRSTGTLWTLHVIQLENGKSILEAHVVPPPGGDVQKSDKGPLQLRENGVEVFGQRFEFDGTTLIKPAPKDKK